MANTVYFDPAVGGTGLTVTDDGNPTTGLDNDGHRERLVPAFSNVVQVAKFVADTAQDVAAVAPLLQPAIDAAATATAAATAASDSADEAEYWAGQVDSIVRTGVGAGDTLLTSRSLQMPAWLKADGGSYLRAAYPVLSHLMPDSTGQVAPKVLVSGINNQVNSADSSGSNIIMVCNNGVAVASINAGVDWSTITIPFSGSDIYAVKHAGGVWFAAGAAGKLYRSTDNGLSWISITNGFGANAIRCVGTNGAGVWIIAGDNGVMQRSTDNGMTFTTIASGFGSTRIRSIAYNDGLWVAVGDSGKVNTSSDNWSSNVQRVSSVVATLYRVSASNISSDEIVAVGDAGTIIRSVDKGVTWAKAVSFFGVSPIYDVINTNGVYVAVGAGAGAVPLIGKSSDGAGWTQIDSDPQLGLLYAVVASGKSVFALSTPAQSKAFVFDSARFDVPKLYYQGGLDYYINTGEVS